MEEEKKEHEHAHELHEHHKKNLTEKIRKNPWILASFIFGVLVFVLLIVTFYSNFTGHTISKEKAADNLVSYLNTIADSQITLVNVEAKGDLYLATIDYKGQDIPFYLTRDGKYYTNTLSPISSEQNSETQTEVPKTDKPSVELYVFSYCPYGTQMEKAIIPAVKLLGDKIDFKIRQIGAMHGDFEKVEAERQLCIEKNYPAKFLDYVLAFDTDSTCSTGDAACIATKTTSIYSKLGIDASKINSCMASEGETLYNAEVSNSQDKGVSGSPTLIINGIETQSSRSAEGVKGTICNAFNNVPSVCSQILDNNQASPGFGSGTSSGSSGTQCG